MLASALTCSWDSVLDRRDTREHRARGVPIRVVAERFRVRLSPRAQRSARRVDGVLYLGVRSGSPSISGRGEEDRRALVGVHHDLDPVLHARALRVVRVSCDAGEEGVEDFVPWWRGSRQGSTSR